MNISGLEAYHSLLDNSCRSSLNNMTPSVGHTLHKEAISRPDFSRSTFWQHIMENQGPDEASRQFRNADKDFRIRENALRLFKTALENWRDYNQKIIDFLEKDWSESVDRDLLNVRVFHTRQQLGGATLQEVLDRLEQQSFSESGSAEFLDEADKVKNSIMRTAGAQVYRALLDCKKNVRLVNSSISDADRHIHYNQRDLESMHRAYDSACRMHERTLVQEAQANESSGS